MAKIVDIIPTNDQVKCVAGESFAVDFAFTNTTGRKLRVGHKLLPGDKTQEQWFKAKGGPEWDLDINATDKLTVTAQVPKDSKPGTYTLQAMIFDVRQPEDHCDLSQTVRIEVGAAPEAPRPVEGKPFPWWILAAVLGVLLVAGLTTWLLWPKGVAVPGVVGLAAQQAKSALQGASLSVAEVTEPSTAAIGEVIRQDPAAGTEVKKDSQVVIYVAGPEAMVGVPNVVRVPFPEAERILGTLNLKAVRKEPLKATREFQPGQVATQNPDFQSQVKPGSVVELEVAGPSVLVPRVKGQMLPAAMEAMAKAKLFVKVTGDQSRLQEGVTGTTPSEDTVVLEGSEVQIHMPGNVMIFIPREKMQIEPILMHKLPLLRKVMPEGGTKEQENE